MVALVLYLLSVWTITGTWSSNIQQRVLMGKGANDSASSVKLETNEGEANLKKALYLDGAKKAHAFEEAAVDHTMKLAHILEQATATHSLKEAALDEETAAQLRIKTALDEEAAIQLLDKAAQLRYKTVQALEPAYSSKSAHALAPVRTIGPGHIKQSHALDPAQFKIAGPNDPVAQVRFEPLLDQKVVLDQGKAQVHNETAAPTLQSSGKAIKSVP